MWWWSRRLLDLTTNSNIPPFVETFKLVSWWALRRIRDLLPLDSSKSVRYDKSVSSGGVMTRCDGTSVRKTDRWLQSIELFSCLHGPTALEPRAQREGSAHQQPGRHFFQPAGRAWRYVSANTKLSFSLVKSPPYHL